VSNPNTLNSSWGSLSMPIAAGSGSDLTALDTARDILLGLLSAALTSELGDAWAAVAAQSPNLPIPTPVGSALPALDDLDTMRQRKAAFPLLSVSRSVEPQQEDEFTIWQNRITSKWTIDYVLGPLEIGNQMKMADALTAAGKIIAATIRRGGHKAYATTVIDAPSGAVTAKQVLGVGYCGFSTVGITGFIQGAASFSQGGAKYHALTMTLQTTELDSIADDGSSYAGAGITLGNPSNVSKTDADVALDTAVPLKPQ